MFQFPAFPSYSYGLAARYIRITACGFPHSDICGSQDMCSLPQLIAAYHVLRRLPVPRHPPDALCNLTKLLRNLSVFFVIAFVAFSVTILRSLLRSRSAIPRIRGKLLAITYSRQSRLSVIAPATLTVALLSVSFDSLLLFSVNSGFSQQID